MFLSQAVQSPSLTIDELLKKTQNEAEMAIAAKKNLEAIELEISARDIVLGWQLNAEYSTVHDDRDQVTFARRSRYDTLTLNLSKPFSTGTTLLLTGNHDESMYDTLGPRNNEAWEVRLTQSLWRDSFGHASSLRHQGERAELISRKAKAYLDLQNFIITVEGLYWDLSLALKEQIIRLKNIQNGEQLEKWTRERVSRSAAEKSDLLQSQALVSQTRLDILNAQNQIEILKSKLKQYFPELTEFSPDDASLMKERDPMSLVISEGSATPRRLDSISQGFLAAQAEAEAKKIKDSYRPKVDAYVAYGQNGIASDFSSAWDRANDADHSITRVGVVLSVDLNRGLVGDRVRASKLAAEARLLEAQTQDRLSKISWDELRRQLALLKARADEAAKLSDLQAKKVIEERKRFKLGRSTVFQLVNYELDAANSELNKYRALVDLRKMESTARLFTTLETENL